MTHAITDTCTKYWTKEIPGGTLRRALHTAGTQGSEMNQILTNSPFKGWGNHNSDGLSDFSRWPKLLVMGLEMAPGPHHLPAQQSIIRLTALLIRRCRGRVAGSARCLLLHPSQNKQWIYFCTTVCWGFLKSEDLLYVYHLRNMRPII